MSVTSQTSKLVSSVPFTIKDFFFFNAYLLFGNFKKCFSSYVCVCVCILLCCNSSVGWCTLCVLGGGGGGGGGVAEQRTARKERWGERERIKTKSVVSVTGASGMESPTRGILKNSSGGDDSYLFCNVPEHHDLVSSCI